MRPRSIILTLLLAVMAFTAVSQPAQQEEPREWYLDEVVSDMFVGRNYFEYYYTPSASEMEQQRARGEVTYFLNTPDGLNVKKVREMIDRLMASYDDVKAMTDWQMTSTTYWKEFRYEKNKFRFSVKRKALEDGTYYVSVTENANWYKSLGKKDKKAQQQAADKPRETEGDNPTRRATRDRRAITRDEADASPVEEIETDTVDSDIAGADGADVPEMSEKEQRQAAREREEAMKREERAAKQRAQDELKAQKKAEEEARKQAERQLKAEEKARKEEEKRLKREQEQRQREEERARREQERQQREQARRQAAAPQPVESRYHYQDIALWLSEKYGFTQTAASETSCTMYTTAIKDVEMAKLAIKNALKGSNARMAIPWRLNSDTGMVETGYTVDDHVLVFAVGINDDNAVTLVVTEVSNEQFELFKQSLYMNTAP